ncbi:MAG: hypothetical protein QM761_06715 [Pseudoxanthomonas sp.]
MDSNYFTAFVGLAGAALGGATSFATTWLIHQSTIRDKHKEAELSKLEALFSDFIMEASLLYADALSSSCDQQGVDKLVKLYALLGKIRLVAAMDVVRCAEHAMTAILVTYQKPNRTLADIPELSRSGELNFLLEFGQACRAQLIADAIVTPRSQR